MQGPRSRAPSFRHDRPAPGGRRLGPDGTHPRAGRSREGVGEMVIEFAEATVSYFGDDEILLPAALCGIDLVIPAGQSVLEGEWVMACSFRSCVSGCALTLAVYPESDALSAKHRQWHRHLV